MFQFLPCVIKDVIETELKDNDLHLLIVLVFRGNLDNTTC